MFGKTKKIDSKIRFQNPRFKHQLEHARGYKRPMRRLPQTDWGVFLVKIGLGSWLNRFLTLLGFFFLVYLVFIPNFLYIKQVAINTTDQSDKASIETLVNSYLNQKSLWSQKNLVLLSKNRLKNYLLKNDQKILSVDGIYKKFPGKLTINIGPRVDRFILQTPLADYIISNDGLITAMAEPDASGSLPSTLFLIKLQNSQTPTENFFIGQNVFPQEISQFLFNLNQKLAGLGQAPLDYYLFSDLNAPDVSVYLKNGLEILFDATSDLDQSLNKLKLLLSQFSDADIKKLYYVDMRFEDRGYVCQKNTPCANNIPVPSLATTSPTSTLDHLNK